MRLSWLRQISRSDDRVGRVRPPRNDSVKYMAKLLEQISQDLKQAMKAREAETMSVLRMLIAAARNKEITLRKNGKAELSDEQAVEVIASEIKKRRDSVAAYTHGNRPELADKESAEIKIIEKYLPEQLGDEDLEKVIKEVIATGATDYGRVMGQTMAKVKGKASGVKVGELVKKLLAK
ncbi:MAG: GatB/Yqey [Parcubacteria group bacterium GW2011_GWC2_42_12]|nr:MAG: GatB/Yqey [Parcubacteria group bacterium GW2011_GWC2_42_12]